MTQRNTEGKKDRPKVQELEVMLIYGRASLPRHVQYQEYKYHDTAPSDCIMQCFPAGRTASRRASGGERSLRSSV